MIVYGTRSSALSSDFPEEIVCPNCETKGSTRLSVFGRYAHIFWIPLFPVGRPSVSECGNCQVAYDKKEMPAEMRTAVEQLSASTKTPIWFFSGLAVIAVLIAVVSYTSSVNKANNEKYINEPLAGDKYEYTSDDGMYSILMVSDVDADSVYVMENTMEVNKKSGLHKIDKSENYMDMAYGISRAEVKDLYETGTIFDVERD